MYTTKNKNPWGKSSLEKDYYCMPSLYFPKGEETAIYELLPEAQWGDSAERRLSENERNIKNEKSRKKREYHQNGIDKQMHLVKELPKGTKKWMIQLFSKDHFIFYETLTEKKAAGVCSSCSAITEYDREVDKPRHNEACECPVCKKRGIYKAKGKQNVIRIEKKAIVMQKTQEGFVSRFFELNYEANETGESIKSCETSRRLYNGKSVKDYYSYKYYDNGLRWTDSNCNGIVKGAGYVYTKNLDAVLDGTPFKYCAMAELQKKTDGPIQHTRLLDRFESYPFIEYMIKMGLYRLTNEYLESPYEANLDCEQRRPDKLLKLPKDRINDLIRINGGIHTLLRMRVECIMKRSFTAEEAGIIDRYKVGLTSLLEVEQYTGMTKFLRYLKKQLRKRKDSGFFVNDWKDYIRMLQADGFELTTANMFPRSLKEEHDKMANAIKTMKSKEKNEKYKQMIHQYNERYSFTYKGLIIMVPESLEAIVKEGNEQHHCVASYVDRVAAGGTCILLLRKEEEPEKPFYTMEIQDVSIVQCRGKYNEDQTPEVKKFLAKFKKEIEKRKELAIRISA
jgi:DNA-directed RNA polymerase subunit RPC12/RpoP